MHRDSEVEFEYDSPNRAKIREEKHIEDLQAILVWFKYNYCCICTISFVTGYSGRKEKKYRKGL